MDSAYNPNSKNVHDFWKKYFDGFNHFYQVWGDKAYELRLAADFLYEEYKTVVEEQSKKAEESPMTYNIDHRRGFGAIWMMICGYCLECLIKGCYFALNEQNLDGGKMVIRWEGSGHNLLTLIEYFNNISAEKYKLQFNIEQSYYLERVSEYSLWAGRYPLPKKYSSYVPGFTPEGLVSPKTAIYMVTDRERFDEIYEVLVALMLKIHADVRASKTD